MGLVSKRGFFMLTCLVIVLLASSTNFALAAPTATQPPVDEMQKGGAHLPIALAAPTATSQPVDLVVLLDVSESIRSLDSAGVTTQAARFVLEYVRATAEQTRIASIAVVRFQRDAEAPLLPPSPPELADAQLLARPLGLTAAGSQVRGGTDFVAGLKAAAGQMGASPLGNRRVIMLITDGESNVAGEGWSDMTLGGQDNEQKAVRDWIKSDLSRDQRVDQLIVILAGAKETFVDYWQDNLRPDDALVRAPNLGDLLQVYNAVAPLSGRVPRLICSLAPAGALITLEDEKVLVFGQPAADQPTHSVEVAQDGSSSVVHKIPLGDAGASYGFAPALQGPWRFLQIGGGQVQLIVDQPLATPVPPTVAPSATVVPTTSTPVPTATKAATATNVPTSTPTLGALARITGPSVPSFLRGLVLPLLFCALLGIVIADLRNYKRKMQKELSEIPSKLGRAMERVRDLEDQGLYDQVGDAAYKGIVEALAGIKEVSEQARGPLQELESKLYRDPKYLRLDHLRRAVMAYGVDSDEWHTHRYALAKSLLAAWESNDSTMASEFPLLLTCICAGTPGGPEHMKDLLQYLSKPFRTGITPILKTYEESLEAAIAGDITMATVVGLLGRCLKGLTDVKTMGKGGTSWYALYELVARYAVAGGIDAAATIPLGPIFNVPLAGTIEVCRMVNACKGLDAAQWSVRKVEIQKRIDHLQEPERSMLRAIVTPW